MASPFGGLLYSLMPELSALWAFYFLTPYGNKFPRGAVLIFFVIQIKTSLDWILYFGQICILIDYLSDNLMYLIIDKEIACILI